MLNIAEQLTMILSVVISTGRAVVLTSVWFWLAKESEWILNLSANDCSLVGHPCSSSPNEQSDWPSHNQPAGIQPLLPLQWYSFSPQKSKNKKNVFFSSEIFGKILNFQLLGHFPPQFLWSIFLKRYLLFPSRLIGCLSRLLQLNWY